MKRTQIIILSGLALGFISCSKIANKNNRSSGSQDPVVTEEPAPVSEGDATAENPDPATPPTDTKMDPAMALTGKELYGKLCATCHQPLAESDVGKTQLNKLKAAIAAQPDMAGLKDTPEKDLEAIVMALSDIPPGKGKGKAAENADQPGEN